MSVGDGIDFRGVGIVDFGVGFDGEFLERAALFLSERCGKQNARGDSIFLRR